MSEMGKENVSATMCRTHRTNPITPSTCAHMAAAGFPIGQWVRAQGITPQQAVFPLD